MSLFIHALDTSSGMQVLKWYSTFNFPQHFTACYICVDVMYQRIHDAILTSLLYQNHVTTYFWRFNDVIIASCVRWNMEIRVTLLSKNNIYRYESDKIKPITSTHNTPYTHSHHHHQSPAPITHHPPPTTPPHPPSPPTNGVLVAQLMWSVLIVWNNFTPSMD